jgi:hypothetical protein
MKHHPVVDDLERYVQSDEFTQECDIKYRRLCTWVSDNSSDFECEESLWPSISDTSTSISSMEPSPHNIPRHEALLYYASILLAPSSYTGLPKKNLSGPVGPRLMLEYEVS